MKKILKIVGIVLGILLIVLLLSPFFLKGSIEKMVKNSIDKNLDADVVWSDFDLSLFRNFPNAALSIKDFSVVNRAPFEGDTLAAGKRVTLSMGIMQLFKSSNESILVDALTFDETLVNIQLDSLGNANYDIAIKSDAPLADETEGNSSFQFDLKEYQIRDSQIRYRDEASETYFLLKEVNHEGQGDFSLSESTLETETTALVTFGLGELEYLTNNKVSLRAEIQMDLEEQKYTFLENEAKVNELPLQFDGFVQIVEEGTNMELTFQTPSSDFKNFLAVLPETYVKNISNVQTTGDFTVNGMLKGTVSEATIPQMDIQVKSTNASFKYPDLPKSVQNITIDARLINDTGSTEDTFLTIGNLTFSIDNEPFQASGTIRNLTGNSLVNLDMKGALNLGNIENVLPVTMKAPLQGRFVADLTTRFDMESIEKEQYQNIEGSGTAQLTDFTYSDPSFQNDIEISRARLALAPGTITLQELNAQSGQTDLSATGNIQNLIPFLLQKQDLKGNFEVRSKTFNVNDFKAPTTASEANTKNATTSPKKGVSIPDFLDATLNFRADRVLYDDLELTNVQGIAGIRQETLRLQNLTSDIFGGTVAVGGTVSTQNATPTFAMDVDLSKISISESFQKLELLEFLTPIARALDGTLNTQLELQGSLTEDMTPKLETLAGNALAQILTAEVDNSKTPLMARLGEKLPFLDISRLSLRDVSTVLNFNNGNIEVQPFDFNLKGINIEVQGRHGLDKSINYNVTMDVPGRYMGSSVAGLLAKLDPADAENVTVALPVQIGGTINSPQVSVNTQAAVNTLTQRLIEKQKQELADKGTNILQDIISGGNRPKDTTGTQQDSSQTQSSTTQVVQDILGGIFNRKRKKDSTNQ
ncbi:AsmA-like C-terminal region-containing protein [Altibacter sp. HG106]|uniref:AsmA-like C-terminal region-containing protein n=1 Tax=Altibacter sp. HG106 TaxID=3023937 RepID=UPI00235105E4|nr:AsmA-like C-terminal region-containing protein [Altibacter sp. HG106]MDC7994607.1 AsmA-like C-terminal region-containing protein [Altibacter sp. HG106]